MDTVLSSSTMTGAVNLTLHCAARKAKNLTPEKVCEPTIIVIPESADKTTISLTRAVVDTRGFLSTEIIKSHELYYQRLIDLFGEQFVISQEENEVLIFHRDWPMSGQGYTIEEAISDLKETLHDLKDHYAHTSIDQLDGRAILFRDFILNSLSP